MTIRHKKHKKNKKKKKKSTNASLETKALTHSALANNRESNATANDNAMVSSNAGDSPHAEDGFPLPPEIQLQIFSFLDPKDLLAVNQVCHATKQISETGLLWCRFNPNAPDKQTFLSIEKNKAKDRIKCARNLIESLRQNGTNIRKHNTVMLLGEQSGVDKFYGLDLDFAIVQTMHEDKYMWRLIHTTLNNFLIFKFSDAIISETERLEALKSLLVDKPLDIALITVTKPEDIAYYDNLFFKRCDIFVLYVIAENALTNFKTLPPNYIVLTNEHEPLPSLYGRVVDVVRQIAEEKDNENTPSWRSCIVS